jgi:hypothetical protein
MRRLRFGGLVSRARVTGTESLMGVLPSIKTQGGALLDVLLVGGGEGLLGRVDGLTSHRSWMSRGSMQGNQVVSGVCCWGLVTPVVSLLVCDDMSFFFSFLFLDEMGEGGSSVEEGCGERKSEKESTKIDVKKNICMITEKGIQLSPSLMCSSHSAATCIRAVLVGLL